MCKIEVIYACIVIQRSYSMRQGLDVARKTRSGPALLEYPTSAELGKRSS